MSLQRLYLVGWGLMGLLVSIALSSCYPGDRIVAEADRIRIEFNESMESRVVARFGEQERALGPFRTSEYLILGQGDRQEFQVQDLRNGTLSDEIGPGRRTVITAESGGLSKEIMVDFYDDFPSMALMQVTYTNTGSSDLTVTGWVNHHYALQARQNPKDDPPFWSYQGASYEDRRDWIVPLREGFEQENNLGMNATDYGGGTPVVDVWRPDVGMALGHVEMSPRLNALPVSMPDAEHAQMAVRLVQEQTLAPGESLETYRTFVSVHTGDFFTTLSDYRRLMMRRGVTFREFADSAYEPVWCAWGYERDFTMKQIYGTLPKAKELGLKWAVLDDGWQTAEGDWFLNPAKFPRGDSDMKRFTDTIRSSGLRPKLWWAPLAVDPGTRLMEEHPEFLLVNREGNHQLISWWDAYYLCPAYGPVQASAAELVRKMFVDWGYDGLKIDGQHLNGAPPCFNEAHGHAHPEESVEAVPEFFRVIFETALSIQPDAVVEICPCGTSYSFFSMPYFNQPVSSDPLSSWQIRTKGKTFKALMGRRAPYYGDHVELSDHQDDFGSTIGIGGVPGTKFTWPVGAKEDSRIDLTPERELLWSKWLKLYEEKALSKGDYRGELYDIGYDRPETHAIERNGRMYYAFYADQYRGELTLRGLEEQAYRVVDYFNEVDLGRVTGPTGRLEVQFSGNLLVETSPE